MPLISLSFSILNMKGKLMRNDALVYLPDFSMPLFNMFLLTMNPIFDTFFLRVNLKKRKELPFKNRFVYHFSMHSQNFMKQPEMKNIRNLA